jgi:hypothetical protein
MKRVLLFLIAATLGAGAQQPQPPAANAMNTGERTQMPSYSDVNCAGFLRQTPLSRTNFVAAGIYAPHTTRYAEGDTLFIEGGGLQEGAVLSLVRELRDPNQNEAFKGQHRAVRVAGQPYADLGRAKVVGMRGNVAIAHVDFACAAIVPGDLAVAYEDRTMPTLPATVSLDRFPADATGTMGQIILAKDFDSVLGTGHKVYLNLGSDKVHVGDTFRIVKSYSPSELQEVDRLSYKATTDEDTQRKSMKISKKELNNLPRRTVGEGVVLAATPGSSTAMITVALEDVLVGDRVEVIPATSASVK